MTEITSMFTSTPIYNKSNRGKICQKNTCEMTSMSLNYSELHFCRNQSDSTEQDSSAVVVRFRKVLGESTHRFFLSF